MTTPLHERSALIVDLDNTLYDWFTAWHGAFAPMLEQLIQISGLSESELKPRIRAVFQRFGTSEYAFLIQELGLSREGESLDELQERFHPAIHAYRSGRKRSLALYPTVRQTLCLARDQGALVVGFTESQSFYTVDRLLRLDLDGVLDVVYTPAEHEIPESVDLDQIRQKPASDYALKKTRLVELEFGAKKPSPAILARIMAEVGASPSQAIYVGDSLYKDIAMAKDCGVLDAYASYGDKKDARYELLRDVSHWTPDEVDREKTVLERWAARGDAEKNPSIVIENSLSEGLIRVRFVPHVRAPFESDFNGERTNAFIEAWKTTVSVQQHFNDLELRIRNFGIGGLTAIVAAFAAVMAPKYSDARLGLAISVLGIVAWSLLWVMDRHRYHRLLKGAVKHGAAIESALGGLLATDAFSLTKRIGEESPVRLLGKEWHSDAKMDLFYGLILACLVLLAAFSGCRLLSWGC